MREALSAMAEVALKMKVRRPQTLDQLVKATGKERECLESLLRQMSVVGLIEYNRENEKREKQYVLPMFVRGSAEFTNMNLKQLEEHHELARFFERMSRLPLEKAISMENKSVDVEHISHWLAKYEGKYAAGPCSCRASRRILGEGSSTMTKCSRH